MKIVINIGINRSQQNDIYQLILSMTLYQWRALDEMEQAEAVWSGTHIADREDDLHNILLYQIDSF